MKEKCLINSSIKNYNYNNISAYVFLICYLIKALNYNVTNTKFT